MRLARRWINSRRKIGDLIHYGFYICTRRRLTLTPVPLSHTTTFLPSLSISASHVCVAWPRHRWAPKLALMALNTKHSPADAVDTVESTQKKIFAHAIIFHKGQKYPDPDPVSRSCTSHRRCRLYEGGRGCKQCGTTLRRTCRLRSLLVSCVIRSATSISHNSIQTSLHISREEQLVYLLIFFSMCQWDVTSTNVNLFLCMCVCVLKVIQKKVFTVFISHVLIRHQTTPM